MKSLTDNKVVNKPYPKLMIVSDNKAKDSGCAGLILLMTNITTGIVVNSGYSSHRIGYQCTYWEMDKFIDYQGTVTLENT